jgi:hypothetical protein
VTDHPYEIGFLEVIISGLAVIEYANPAPACFEFLFRNHMSGPSLEFIPVHF